jgi:hypothetical protein
MLEHQSEEVAADGTSARQTVVRPQDHFGREPEDFAINRGADHGRHIIVLGDKGTGDDNVISRFGATLRNPLAGSVNFSSPHERACSTISARAWRVSCLRCFRKMAPSLASVARFRSLSAYCRSAIRTSALRLRRRDDFSVRSSRSFAVASSIAMVFMRGIISAILARAQVLCSIPAVRILTGISS